MGRPPLYPDRTICRLPAGTLAEIDAALRDGETAADLIRAAISRELASRKRAENRKRPIARRRG
jgi:hypothetical protein